MLSRGAQWSDIVSIKKSIHLVTRAECRDQHLEIFSSFNSFSEWRTSIKVDIRALRDQINPIGKSLRELSHLSNISNNQTANFRYTALEYVILSIWRNKSEEVFLKANTSSRFLGFPQWLLRKYYLFHKYSFFQLPVQWLIIRNSWPYIPQQISLYLLVVPVGIAQAKLRPKVFWSV